MGNIYVDDIGTILRLDIDEDLTDASTTEIRYKKPDGSTGVWVATKSSTHDNCIEYIMQSGDMNLEGQYKVYAYLVFPTWRGRGEIATFVVEDNFF